MRLNKKWYRSKTLWVNAVAFLAIGIQVVTDNQILISPEKQALALPIINVILRWITKEGIE